MSIEGIIKSLDNFVRIDTIICFDGEGRRDVIVGGFDVGIVFGVDTLVAFLLCNETTEIKIFLVGSALALCCKMVCKFS